MSDKNNLIDPIVAVPRQDEVEVWVSHDRTVEIFQDRDQHGQQFISVREVFLDSLIDILTAARDRLKATR